MKSIFWAEDKAQGFSTIGMALALLISLSLIFTCAQVYEVQSTSAQIQEVADAAALSAENLVAEFYTVATLCDAFVFTLSLGVIACAGIGVVCACIPPAQSLSKTFLDAAQNLKKARTSFYDSSSKALDNLQKALPFLAQVKAQEVLAANNSSSSYVGLVVLSPWEAHSFNELSFDKTDDALTEILNNNDELEEFAKQAEQAAQEANAAKQRAYSHDSGSRTSYCMFERASALASLSGADNPYFSSIDTWNFQVALSRAQAYYRARYLQEKPLGSTTDDRADSALRKRFYAYAQGKVNDGYVHDLGDSFEAYFPLLPKNTSEMRASELYTEAVYPLTIREGKYELHAYDSCPGIAQGEACGVSSISAMDNNEAFATCNRCHFTPASMGKVAAASSSIENGFEYHYNEVAQAASEYQAARVKMDPLSQKVKGLAQNLFDQLKDSLQEIALNRIAVYPPGNSGAVMLVADTSQFSSSFTSAFVTSSSSLGTRAAISAATLVEENSEEGKNVINSFLDGAYADSSGAMGGFGLVLDLWSTLLGTYTQGYDALVSGVKNALDRIPLASASGLGSWAADSLEQCLDKAGFTPPNLLAKKAVLVNSAQVLEEDTSSFSARLLSVKQQALSLGANVSFDSALSSIEGKALDVVEQAGVGFQVATITIFDGVLEIPITLSLPAPITNTLSGWIQKGISSLRGITSSIIGGRQWR